MLGSNHAVILYGFKFKELATLIFTNAKIEAPPAKEGAYNFLLPKSDFTSYVDLLRKEKPLTFRANEKSFKVFISAVSIGDK